MYGGSGIDAARSILQTDDGGFIFTGKTYSDDGDVSGLHGIDDFWVVKMNDAGVIDWQRCIGGTARDKGYSICHAHGGGYIIAGTTQSNDGDVSGLHIESGSYGGGVDGWVAKINELGTVEWQKCLGNEYIDEIFFVNSTNDNGYIAAGATRCDTSSYTMWNGWIIKMDGFGNTQWESCLSGPNMFLPPGGGLHINKNRIY